MNLVGIIVGILISAVVTGILIWIFSKTAWVWRWMALAPLGPRECRVPGSLRG